MELLKEAQHALACAVAFMAGSFESAGRKSQEYEQTDAWRFVNEPRQRIDLWLEENDD